jgi:hypothetical protein
MRAADAPDLQALLTPLTLGRGEGLLGLRAVPGKPAPD